MFTIKHIENGCEHLHEAKFVSYREGRTVAAKGDPQNQQERVEFIAPHGDVVYPITDGIVYVMNAAGKTVATYQLDLKDSKHN